MARRPKGDMLEHKAFGRGMVLSAQRVGGDTLLEIAFDGVGTAVQICREADGQKAAHRGGQRGHPTC